MWKAVRFDQRRPPNGTGAGFTLIELLVAIAVIAILVAAWLSAWGQEESRRLLSFLRSESRVYPPASSRSTISTASPIRYQPKTTNVCVCT